MQVALRLALVAALLALGAAAFALARGRAGAPEAGRAVNLALGLFAALVALALAELFLSLRVQSDGYGFTLMGRTWSRRYWEPINSFGYRDVEHAPEELRAKKALFVVGDSFVAGYGLRDPADRFADRLRGLLGPEWAVVNIARNGWNTTEEIVAIFQYPVRPDFIVLSYHVNDFEGAAQREGLFPPPFAEKPPPWLGALLDHSFLLDVVYWRAYRFLSMAEVERRWSEFILAALRDPAVWARHERQLMLLVRYARSNDIGLAVVMFPFLADPDWAGSRRILDAAREIFAREGVPTLDLSQQFRGRDPRTLTVNSLDAHPNAATHREVAELLAGEIRRLGW